MSSSEDSMHDNCTLNALAVNTPTSMLDELSVKTALLENTPKAFFILYDKYAPSLYAYILWFTDDKKLAACILKASWEKIFLDRYSYKPQNCNLFSWMLQITLQECKRLVPGQTNQTIKEVLISKLDEKKKMLEPFEKTDPSLYVVF